MTFTRTEHETDYWDAFDDQSYESLTLDEEVRFKSGPAKQTHYRPAIHVMEDGSVDLGLKDERWQRLLSFGSVSEALQALSGDNSKVSFPSTSERFHDESVRGWKKLLKNA
jgi:hypothetical protein